MKIDTLKSLPKLDAHMHIWDLTKPNNPWLTEVGKIDFRYGDYSTIRQNYLVDNYLNDFAEHNIVGSVFVETEWTKWGIEDEICFVENNNKHNFIKAIICQGWLDDNFAKQIDILTKHPLVKGIRQKPKIIEPADYRADKIYQGTMLDPKFMDGLTLLAENNLIFEVQTAWWHLPEIIQVKAKLPQLKIIINHAGMPQVRDDKTIHNWHNTLTSIADIDDVYLKISGFGKKQRWEFSRNKVIFDTLLDTFAIDKLLFASNFPVDKVVVDANQLMDGFYNGFGALTETDISKLFYHNAHKIYNIKEENEDV